MGGWYDTGQILRGEIDARVASERLAGGSDVEILTSDRTRASQTEAIIAKRLHRPVVSTPDLREISCVSAHGVPVTGYTNRRRSGMLGRNMRLLTSTART
ncbi:histidine phosphatase family protein [Ensifer sp. 22521]|uniref:histidine phosphatase family protein n=1 Tax=Ensifer sp. 22521 TaxID=3453935 RepID=UPI003F863FC6